MSDGQFQQCLDQKLPQIQYTVCHVYKELHVPLPKVLLICAVKRHHHRFYPTQPAFADGNGNPRPGLIIDNGVTYDPGTGFKDWFSISHKAMKGTARPAHYVILHDDGKNDPADIQMMVGVLLCLKQIC